MLALRRVRDALGDAYLPMPRIGLLAYLALFVTLRKLAYFLRRQLVAGPLTRAYCAKVGKRFRTDIYVPWVQGHGRIIVGDDVRFQGKLSFTFAARFADIPTVTIGDRTRITHGTVIVVGRSVEIGSDVRIAANAEIRDSSGHPLDPETRRLGAPPAPEDVRPVVIGNNVWIGNGAVILPGTIIGEGAVIATKAVVSGVVAPYTLVAGNPARRVSTIVTSPPKDPVVPPALAS